MDFNTEYTLQAYQAQAARTSNHNMTIAERTTTSIIGLFAEVGEIATELQHASERNNSIDWDNIREEIGDCCWRLADICSARGWSLAEVCHENIIKLQKRHPDGFTPQTSIARMDKNGDARDNA